MTRLSVQHSEIQSDGAKGFQVHAVQRPRLGGARAGVHQGVPDGLPAFRDEIGNEGTGGNAGEAASRRIPDLRMREFTIQRESAERT